MRQLALPLAAVALALISVGGCATRARVSYATYARVAPPAPLVEVTGPTPAPDAVWANGYWYWNGVDYVWVRGHWATPPDENYAWVRSGWVVEGGEYRFIPGRWTIRGRGPRVRYVHPAPRVIRRGPAYRAVPPRVGAPRVPIRPSGGARVRPR